MSAFKWGLIDSGATFHALVGDLLLHADPLTRIYNRDGADGAIDALSADRKTVFQSKHHKQATPGKAFADARKELAKIVEYRKSTDGWYPIWKDVTTWRLVSNVPFGPADDKKWSDEIVPAFATHGLSAEYVLLPQLEAMLTDHPAVADAFFGQRPRLFVSLFEHREALLAREVLPRAYDVPLEGRDGELDAIASFVRNSDHQVLLVHGPGGLGKSRLVLEAAFRLAADGSVNTVYAGTPHLATSDNWYVGIVPETKALVILDEPTDPRFVERFLAELRTRTKQWKVVVAVRTPRDPVIRALTDPRERLLAPACELVPLPNDSATRFATTLLAPLAIPDDERPRLTRWLADVCGRVPIWMTVAVTLLERGVDLRALPRDEFEIAQRYLRDILDHTRPEIADAERLLRFLRWIAVAQPVNRHSDAEMEALAASCGLEVGAVDRIADDLIRRRVVTAFGIRGRMLELRPDVMRDHILIDWLSVDRAGTRAPTADARTLATSLAATESLSRVAQSVIRALGRMEFLIQPRIRFLDPIAEAAIQRADRATDTIDQQAALELASIIAPARPGNLARVARAIRTREVPESTQDTVMGPFTHSRAQLVASLPWELFAAAHAASTSEERQLILNELVCLVDGEGSRPRTFYTGGKTAHELLPRVIQERHGYRSSYQGEAATAARAILDALGREEPPQASWQIVLSALLRIERHDTYNDDADDSVFHFERMTILSAGELGRIVLSIRERLWEIVQRQRPWSPSRKLCWSLLDSLHSQLNQHKSDPGWAEPMIDDLRRAGTLVSDASTSLEDLQAARALWKWHLKYDKNAEIKTLASGCEAAYLATPLVARFASIFARESMGGDLIKTARTFPLPNTIADLDAFFLDALRFGSTHTDERSVDRVLSFALLLGEQRAADVRVLRDFSETHLRAGSSDPLFAIALAIAGGYTLRVRADGDSDALARALEQFATCIPTGSDTVRLLDMLYVQPGPVSARRFGAVDFEFLSRRWDAFSSLPHHDFFTVLGRLMPARNEALDRALERLSGITDEEASAAVGFLWHGYFETLPYPFTAADVELAIVNRMVEVSALLPDSRGAQGNLEWEIGQVLEHMPAASLDWLVDLVRRRLAAFGDRNRTREGGRPLVHLLPHDESFIFERVDTIPDEPPTDAARRAIADLFELEHADITIEHDLPEFLAHLDPHGRIVPEVVAARIADPFQSATADDVEHAARFAGWYSVGSVPWRVIAAAACARAATLGEEERRRVYSQLRSHRMESWSGRAGQIHPRWQDAVDESNRALENEQDPNLRGFWQWNTLVAQERLEVARGRLEERD